MILIFGGVYQGKLNYAKKRFGEDRTIINNIDRLILDWIKAGESVPEKLRALITDNKDAVIICNDISCGIVPTDALQRKWREEAGRAMAVLAEHADEVIRLFCGIPTVLKG